MPAAGGSFKRQQLWTDGSRMPDIITGFAMTGYAPTSATPVKICNAITSANYYQITTVQNYATGTYTSGKPGGPIIFVAYTSANLSASGSVIYKGEEKTFILEPSQALWTITQGNQAAADVRVRKQVIHEARCSWVFNVYVS